MSINLTFADLACPICYFAPGALRRIARRMALALLCAVFLVLLFADHWIARLIAAVLFVSVVFEAVLHATNLAAMSRSEMRKLALLAFVVSLSGCTSIMSDRRRAGKDGGCVA